MVRSLNTRWRDGDVTLGIWLMTPGADTAEVLAPLGFDYLCIDRQHGLVGDADVIAVLRAIRTSEATPIVRVASHEPSAIGTALDAGALGVVVPMVNDRHDAQQAVAACRYAPMGARSFGPTRAALVHGPDYATRANQDVSCIPMIETVEALDNLDEILAVEGVDAAYVGPSDLGVSMGIGPGVDHDDDRFRDGLRAVLDGCQRHGVVPGIHATPELAARRVEEGFRMVTVTADFRALQAGASAALAQAMRRGS